MDQALRPTDDPAWLLGEVGYDPLRESSFETRFAISNGFLGLRGALATDLGACRTLPPRTYVAGLFDTALVGAPIPERVPAPDWLQLRIGLPDGPLLGCPDPYSRDVTLDMRRGVLLTQVREPPGAVLGIRLSTLRLVSLDMRGIILQLVELAVERGMGEITLDVTAGEAPPFLIPHTWEADLGVWRTRQSGKALALAMDAVLIGNGRTYPPTVRTPGKWSWSLFVQAGQTVVLQRILAVTRGDEPVDDPGGRARSDLDLASGLGWRNLLERHETAWRERWDRSDIVVEGDPEAQRALRFAIFHLNGAADPRDERVSIGARALTGDDYLGHVFWDTEIFLLPFYAMTWPRAARALLMYRFHTLDAARAKAARMGWRGALYAWESADTGDEATPAQVVGPDRKVVDILCGTQEQHVSADVAYAVWQYWQATDDTAFLLEAGAEIILETARFWWSRAGLEADGLHHIRGVIGPDEYHETIDDNAFTNVMARWNLSRGLDVAAMMGERWPDRWATLSTRLDLADDELEGWRMTAAAMATGLDPKTGLFEQFEGYSDLEAIDLAAYAGRSVPMDVVLGRERTQASQVVKQADVVAMLALLPEEFLGNSGAVNFDHYAPRCGHGSSLSRALHGVAAARLGRSELALGYFRATSAIDLGDSHVAIGGGVHIAALGGIWLVAVIGFAGLVVQAGGLSFAPRLPSGWTRLSFPVQWRGRDLVVTVDPGRQTLDATLRTGDAMTVSVGLVRRTLNVRASIRIPLPRSTHLVAA